MPKRLISRCYLFYRDIPKKKKKDRMVKKRIVYSTSNKTK